MKRPDVLMEAFPRLETALEDSFKAGEENTEDSSLSKGEVTPNRDFNFANTGDGLALSIRLEERDLSIPLDMLLNLEFRFESLEPLLLAPVVRALLPASLPILRTVLNLPP